MCQSCEQFAASGRKVRRCPVTASTIATTRARQANNTGFRRELAAAAARELGTDVGSLVMKANPADMPLIVEALGRDPHSFVHTMPGDGPNLDNTDRSGGAQVAEAIEKARAREADEQAKAAAAQKAADEAARQAAEQERAEKAAELAAENAELSEQAGALGMTPEQLADARLTNETNRSDESELHSNHLEDIASRRDRAEKSAALAYEKGRDRIAARHEATLLALDEEEDAAVSEHEKNLAAFDAEDARLGGDSTTSAASPEKADEPAVAPAEDDYEPVSAYETMTDDELDAALADEAPTPTAVDLTDWRARAADVAADTTGDADYMGVNGQMGRALGKAADFDAELTALENEDYPRKKNGELTVNARKQMDKDIDAILGSLGTINTTPLDQEDDRRIADALYAADTETADAIRAERDDRNTTLAAARDEMGRRASRLRDARDGFDPESVDALRGYLDIPDDQPVTTYDLASGKIAKARDAELEKNIAAAGLREPLTSKAAALRALDAAQGFTGDTDSSALDDAEDAAIERMKAAGHQPHHAGTGGAVPSNSAGPALRAAREVLSTSGKLNGVTHSDDGEALAAVPGAYVSQMIKDDAAADIDAGNAAAGRTASRKLVGAAGNYSVDEVDLSAEDVGDDDYRDPTWTSLAPDSMKHGASWDRRLNRTTPSDVELGQIIQASHGRINAILANAEVTEDAVRDNWAGNPTDEDVERATRINGAYVTGVRAEFASRVRKAMEDPTTWPQVAGYVDSFGDPDDMDTTFSAPDVYDRNNLDELEGELVTPEIEGQESLFDV